LTARGFVDLEPVVIIFSNYGQQGSYYYSAANPPPAAGGNTINAEQYTSWSGTFTQYVTSANIYVGSAATSAALQALEAYNNAWLQTRLDVSYTNYSSSGDLATRATTNIRRGYRTYS